MVVPPCVGFEAFKDTTGPILFTEKSLHYSNQQAAVEQVGAPGVLVILDPCPTQSAGLLAALKELLQNQGLVSSYNADFLLAVFQFAGVGAPIPDHAVVEGVGEHGADAVFGKRPPAQGAHALLVHNQS